VFQCCQGPTRRPRGGCSMAFIVVMWEWGATVTWQVPVAVWVSEAHFGGGGRGVGVK
jgi:hypothetical protein